MVEEQEKKWPWFAPEQSNNRPKSFAWPKISIVTPSFNQVDTIEETIRSVLLQDYPDLEYIIIDGGSTDGSVEIIKKYENKLTYWISEKDYGQSNAINKGWNIATGELVSWLNSDDCLKYGVLERVADIYINQNMKNVGLIYGKAEIIKDNFFYTIGEQFDVDFCFRNLIDTIPQPSAFISRRILDEIGFLDEKLHYAMDLDLFFRLSLLYSLVFIDETFSYIRYSLDTKTSINPMGFVDDHFIVLEKMKNDPILRSKCNHLLSSSYASNYLRRMKINYINGRKIRAVNDMLKALTVNPLFTIHKILKILRNGPYISISVHSDSTGGSFLTF